ncbi:PAF acetylhydrolase family protein [Phaeosphaeriaceae sp. PMI808]|nr:PAF acetylhydrolase family protein [Phaeosphaeriaceae sp. PMI808]
MAVRATRLIAALAVWPAFVTPTVVPVIGIKRYDVAINSALLTDSDRVDTFANDGRARSVMVSSYGPVASCQNKQVEPYMPPKTAASQDEKYGAYGLPNGTFRLLEVENCKDVVATKGCSSGSPPLVVFSGALGTSRLLYSNMLQNVAAAGYLVVSVDHPYDADIVEFPNGTVITGVDIESDADIERTLTARTEDMIFVREQMANETVKSMLFPGQLRGHAISNAAYIGHSLGGATAALAMLHDPTVAAGLNIDGSMFGDVLTVGLDRPFMLIGHENKTQATDPTWKAIWPQLKGWKNEIEVRGAAHYGFSDLPLIAAVLGFQSMLPPEVGQVLGTVEGHHMANITAAFTTAFLDMVLKSGLEDMLLHGDASFPEVVKVA